MFPPWTTYPVTIFRCTLSRFCEDTRIGAGSRGHDLLDWFMVKFEFQSSTEYKKCLATSLGKKQVLPAVGLNNHQGSHRPEAEC